MNDERLDAVLRKKDAEYRRLRQKGIDTALKHSVSLLLSDLETTRIEPLLKRYHLTQSELIRLAIHHFAAHVNPSK
ncbi:hypothetical protein MUN81_10275 [Hymenobacter sp. 5317J-9]|uniref:hypothetical protein n=1 Tax=Hymenobacter sp. 5317J-9 TaxID=2932250 RepID=UPI001FD6DC1F|nr:hypothetical protein [Hymenobacter sp. 5317J-9]UOQ99864.1 hypothetical protein MUN81_10275 [Hymenobacter sp. 5317J-9]